MKFTIPVVLACLLLSVPQAHSRPAFSEQDLVKARKAASTAKYPIDFDKLMDEADRLGVECEGDLTEWIWIEMCKLDVEASQIDERIEQSKRRQEQMRQETIEAINKAAGIAEKKLKEME